MSDPSRRPHAGAPDRADGARRWTGAVLTVLVHLLLLLLVLLSPPITVTDPQGSDAGGRMEVTYIDRNLDPPPTTVAPPKPKPSPAARPKAAPKATRVQTTPVPDAVDPVPPDAPDPADTPTPSPPDPPVEPDPRQTETPPASPPPMRRSNPLYGQPPGMRMEDLAPVNAGPARSPGTTRGRSNNTATAGADMEVDGYQVYYELVSENRLRGWRDAGMTELFLPLPGTRRMMVCPLEVALRRGSGKCRMVEPDSPELSAIGDARQVITMQRVYKLGEVVWDGPGAYR